MITFMFPGQGSQARGMGGSLFDEFSTLTDKADVLLGYSIKELCLEDPRNELGKTQFTQPALFVVNALSHLKRVSGPGGKPDYLAGHSLGEFNALCAAECFDFETGLTLVKKRGELMGAAANGGMAAIVNASKDEIEKILKDNGLTNVDLANYNTPSQIVISGSRDELATAQPLFERGKMHYYPLNTSGAFHSRFMQSAREEFKAFLKTVPLANLKIPVIANATARPYQSEEVIETLSSQIASAVRWSESIQYLMSLRPNGSGPIQFEEIGHGNVLTKLLHAIKQHAVSPPAAEHTAAKTSDHAQKVDIVAVPQGVSGALEHKPNGGGGKAATSAEKVAAWNKAHSIGTKVRSLVRDYGDLETRTEAVVLFGHRAAVYMRGYNGYFDLDELTPL